jgi:two-component system chemotaxis response regulator CheY
MAYNILIVDDSSPMRSVIKKTLEASGFNIGRFFHASNGENALEVLKKEWIDLVLTDYHMPDMNGIELIHGMKKDEILSAIPVVVITTEGSQKRVKEFFEEGAIDYIKKPFAPEDIMRKLNHILGEKGDGDGEGISDKGDEGLDF